MVKWTLLKAIRYYQKTGGSQRHFALSCNFTPTCSEYTYQAVNRFGVLRGITLGAKRICRCNDRDCVQVIVDPLPESVVSSTSG